MERTKGRGSSLLRVHNHLSPFSPLTANHLHLPLLLFSQLQFHPRKLATERVANISSFTIVAVLVIYGTSFEVTLFASGHTSQGRNALVYSINSSEQLPHTIMRHVRPYGYRATRPLVSSYRQKQLVLYNSVVSKKKGNTIPSLLLQEIPVLSSPGNTRQVKNFQRNRGAIREGKKNNHCPTVC